MNAEQHIPIFVGSTYQDLKEYRAKLKDTLTRMETYKSANCLVVFDFFLFFFQLNVFLPDFFPDSAFELLGIGVCGTAGTRTKAIFSFE